MRELQNSCRHLGTRPLQVHIGQKIAATKCTSRSTVSSSKPVPIRRAGLRRRSNIPASSTSRQEDTGSDDQKQRRFGGHLRILNGRRECSIRFVCVNGVIGNFEANLPITRASSTGRCNTGLQFTRRSFKAQGFSRR